MRSVHLLKPAQKDTIITNQVDVDHCYLATMKAIAAIACALLIVATLQGTLAVTCQRPSGTVTPDKPLYGIHEVVTVADNSGTYYSRCLGNNQWMKI